MMRGGVCWELPPWADFTIEKECGSRQFFPTPTVCGNYNRKGVTKNAGDGLWTAVRGREKLWPTPCAEDANGANPETDKSEGRRRSPCLHFKAVLSEKSSVRLFLNPYWLEWLLGWPIGWMDLDMDHLDRWLDASQDPADLPAAAGRIPRATEKVKDWRHKIKSGGNGQFPLSAALAFEWEARDLCEDHLHRAHL
jgi:hypothetical protein